jgi:hypothetical protein
MTPPTYSEGHIIKNGRKPFRRDPSERFRLTSTNNHVNAYEIDFMPTPRLSFVTAEEERFKLIKEAKEHYVEYVESQRQNNFFDFIESRFLKKYQPDSQLVKRHNVDSLNRDWQIPEGAFWDQRDVVADILAFLAEQMIELGKAKREETENFLKWLESQLKIQPNKKGSVGIEALDGKSQIKNYCGDYQKKEELLSFEQLWNILMKNQSLISTNLKSRELYGTIKSEYEKSLTRLLHLERNRQKTDWLIDQIVYRLYGLTEDEIKIVEGSVRR